MSQSGGEEPALALGAFGLSLLTDADPPGAWERQSVFAPSLRIRCVEPQAIAASWSGVDAIGWEGIIDGAPFVAERGIEGDHRFVHGAHPHVDGSLAGETRAIHRLASDSSLLECSPADPADQTWWRVVLDSVLFTAALTEGYEALHAGAVAAQDGVIAITAATGGGKSTLLTELLRRGLPLFADDVLTLQHREGSPPLAHPGPPLMTVPAEIPAAADALIASVGEEHWIAVPVHHEPLPLNALVVLDRRASAQLSLTAIDDALAPLLGSLLNYPRSPARQRARFELAGELAATTSLWRLTADLDTTPAALADVLLAGMV